MGTQNIQRLIDRCGAESLAFTNTKLTTPTITNAAITGGTIVNANISGSGVTLGAGATLETPTVNNAAIVNAAISGSGGVINTSTLTNCTLNNTSVATNKVITLGDNANIAVNATTGSVIATNNTQKLGFWGATPVAQQAALANVANDGNSNINTVIQRVNAITTSLHNTGFIA